MMACPSSEVKPKTKPEIPEVTQLVRLGNFDQCKDRNDIAPDEGEDQHYYAVRLTAPKFPWVFKGVQYNLRNRPPSGGAKWTCSSEFDHEVKVWKQASSVPDATPPAETQTIKVAAVPNKEQYPFYDLPLPKAITVNEGESLYVAVQMGGTVPKTTCIATCKVSEEVPGRIFWSYASAPPFAWEEFKTAFINIPSISAYGGRR